MKERRENGKANQTDKMDKTAAPSATVAALVDATAAEDKSAAPTAASDSLGAGASKKPPNPEKLRAALRMAEERCVGMQEKARFLIRPDIFRKVDELQRMVAEVEARADQLSKLDPAEPANEEEKEESAEKPMETEEAAKTEEPAKTEELAKTDTAPSAEDKPAAPAPAE